jgi:hypothetical protein
MTNPSLRTTKIVFVARRTASPHCFSCKFNVFWVLPFLQNKGDVIAHFDLLYKLFLYRAEQEKWAPGTPKISGQSECGGDKVVSPRHRPPLTSGGIRPTHFC